MVEGYLDGFGREPRFFEEDWYPLMQGDVPELVCQKQCMLHCMLVTQQPVDTALVYSRDSTAGPLVHLQRTLDDIASEVSKPDCTGLVHPIVADATESGDDPIESLASAMAEEHTSDDPDLESESSSEDSRDEEFGEDDLQLAAEAENEIVPLWNQLGMM